MRTCPVTFALTSAGPGAAAASVPELAAYWDAAMPDTSVAVTAHIAADGDPPSPVTDKGRITPAAGSAAGTLARPRS
ncbi:hypothetical protein FB157_11185 [Streptomyces sp. BK340]|nr:hypothetical protein FB157_11185 [Streptomyces sp. BK340]